MLSHIYSLAFSLTAHEFYEIMSWDTNQSDQAIRPALPGKLGRPFSVVDGRIWTVECYISHSPISCHRYPSQALHPHQIVLVNHVLSSLDCGKERNFFRHTGTMASAACFNMVGRLENGKMECKTWLCQSSSGDSSEFYYNPSEYGTVPSKCDPLSIGGSSGRHILTLFVWYSVFLLLCCSVTHMPQIVLLSLRSKNLPYHRQHQTHRWKEVSAFNESTSNKNIVPPSLVNRHAFRHAPSASITTSWHNHQIHKLSPDTQQPPCQYRPLDFIF